MIYTQVSNIFLAKITSYSDLGIYNVALTLGSAYSFIPVALITSFFSKIYQEKDFEKMSRLLTLINRIVIVITILYYLVFIFLGRTLSACSMARPISWLLSWCQSLF